MWRVMIGIRPSFLTLCKRDCVGQLLLRDQLLKRSEPMLIIACAIVGLTAMRGVLQLF